MDSARDCQFADSRSSSVLVRVDRADLVERRVVRWATVLQCVRANVVRCIRRATCLHRVVAQWERADLEWLDVRWALGRDSRLRELHRHVRVRVRRSIVVRGSVIKVRAVSKKDR